MGADLAFLFQVPACCKHAGLSRFNLPWEWQGMMQSLLPCKHMIAEVSEVLLTILRRLHEYV